MATSKRPKTIRLSERARAIIKQAVGWYGVSETAVVEIALLALGRAGPPAWSVVSREEVAGVEAESKPPGRPRRKK